MKDLLELIRTGVSISTVELARETGSTQEMVIAKLEYYEAMHIIKRVTLTEDHCGGHCGTGKCAGCSQSPANKPPLVMWEMVK